MCLNADAVVFGLNVEFALQLLEGIEFKKLVSLIA